MEEKSPEGHPSRAARDTLYQQVLDETARALAEASTLAGAAPGMLRAVCEALGWQYGALWEVDHARSVLRCIGTWQSPDLPANDFSLTSMHTTFAPGIGLPGRVWASGQPAWIPDVTRDANFPRAAVAQRAGLHTAIGLPVLAGANVLGVMEFFSRDRVEPTAEFLSTLTTVGRQIGMYFERKWAGEDFDRFFTLSLDLFCVASFDGRFIRVNGAWQRLLGFSDEELCATPFMDFVCPDDHEATRAALSGLSTGAHVIDFENRYRTRDGSYKWLQWAAAPSPERGLIYAAARDVTDRKAAEEAVRRHAREMEQATLEQERNAGRLAELVGQLDIARRSAEQAAVAKGEFLANMSHEIRTPMNAILGMTTLVLQSRLTAEQRDYLHTVRESAEALLTIIDDILDVSKIEAGRLVLDPTPFRLRDTIEDGVRLLAPKATEKDLELVCRIAPDVPDALVGDRGRLRQILLNLVGNAIKFTHAGEVVVAVSLDHTAPDEVALRMSVTDTGIGIPQDKLHDIFSAFTQADASTTRRYGGTGLGLTISAQLAELMGGRLQVESVVGTGSCFHFTARFALDREPGPAVPQAADSLQGLRVLVVDDNASARSVLAEVLASWQMQVVVADGASAALAMLRDAAAGLSPISLVLTDALMPGVDGFMLAAQIARDRRLAATKVILLSSTGVARPRSRSRRPRIAGHLTKPVKQSELLDAVLSAVAPPGRPGPLRNAQDASLAAIPSVGPLRVLLAEDNAANQRLVLALLEQRGHHVVVVESGRQAVERSAAQPFDVIVMDVQMPEMSGLEATAAIRAKEQETGARRVPILALTAHAMSGDRERFLAAGMDAYLSKPIRFEELYRMIDRLCAPSDKSDRHRTETPASSPTLTVNRASLLAAFGGRAALLADVANVFLVDAPRMRERLQTAVRAGDAPQVAAAAHAIKGAVGLFSRGEAYESAKHLEQVARAGDLSPAAALCADVERDVSGLMEELRALIRDS